MYLPKMLLARGSVNFIQRPVKTAKIRVPSRITTLSPLPKGLLKTKNEKIMEMATKKMSNPTFHC